MHKLKIMAKLKKLFIFIILSNSSFAQNQTTDTIVMVSPEAFRYNEQTALTNSFQHNSSKNSNKAVLKEFNGMVTKLKKENIDILVLQNRKGVETPDAVFPNNWFSVFSQENNHNLLVLYPMLNNNRQLERQADNLKELLGQNDIKIDTTLDLTDYEKRNLALEGTGSLVLDREHKFAFASLSPRASEEVLRDFTKKIGYQYLVFNSLDLNGKAIYHTNVVMSIGKSFAVLCSECIKDSNEKNIVLSKLKELGKDIIEISAKQTTKMAGNILEVQDKQGKSKTVMSMTAYKAFTPTQKAKIKQSSQIIVVDIPTIERIGGGSARCMMAEIFH